MLRRGLTVGLLCALLPLSVLAGNVTKFTFEDVVFSDGTVGVIEAGVKVGKRATVTVCDYYTVGHVEYLGQFESFDSTATDANAVEQFCLDNYANRAA